MTLEEFASRIEEARTKPYKAGPCYKGRCPACAQNGRDQGASHFVVWEGADEWLHVRCITGCTEEQILSSLGLTSDDRRVKPYEPSEGPEKLPIHTYERIGGGYGAEKHRKVRPDGKKYCVWKVRFEDGVPLAKVEHTIGSGPRKGETFMDYPTPDMVGLNGELDVLYRFQDVRRAIDAGKTIYIGEGEPATECAKKLGICHTCQRAGAGPNKWLSCYTAQLQGAKDICIVADRDAEGEKYATEVFTLLRAAGLPVRVVRSRTTREHDDFRDHLEAGFKEDELIPAPDLMPPRGLKIRETTSAAKLIEAEHIIAPYFPRRATVILDGRGGTKKSFFMVCIAAALSNGYDPINRVYLPAPTKTLYIHKGGTEDDPAGGDNTDEKLNTIYRANGGVGEFYTADLDHLDEANCQLLIDSIKDGNFGLIVIDYLFQFFDGMHIDINNPADAITICRRLLRVAVSTDSCIVPLRHHSKGGDSKNARDPSELGSGTNQWHDGMRGHLVFRKHPDEEQRSRGVIVVTDVKGDLLNEQGDAIIFSRLGNEMRFEIDLPDPFDNAAISANEASSKMTFACQWMVENLTGQLVNTADMISALEHKKVAKRTIERARKKCKVKSIKKPDGSWWVTIEYVDPFAD